MVGLIGRFVALPGKRDELIAAMTRGMQPMPGCHGYVVAKDPESADGVWITEVWESLEHHEASLQIDWVKKAIATAMPLIAEFKEHILTEPVAKADRIRAISVANVDGAALPGAAKQFAQEHLSSVGGERLGRGAIEPGELPRFSLSGPVRSTVAASISTIPVRIPPPSPPCSASPSSRTTPRSS